ncbi:ion channel protein AlgE [Pseudomonas otitidis]|uniref:ion channel protein AlgE n=1 Tax=Metapseudomonas otitidis TaxID=319939 RepID=UPI0024AD7847|nr:ion channel protein AlgE [Pseudomonas otitidis]MDI6525058.1 ion channel protein AlgE [Pseudomonas otitidis]
MNEWKALLCIGAVTVSGAVAAAEEDAFGPAPTPAEPAALSLDTLPPVTSEFFNKLTLQGGYGPEDSVLGADRKGFYSLRYEPSYHWYSPEKRWARWEVFGRAWINYDSSQSATPLQDDNFQQSTRNERPEHFYSELRELYVRRNLLGDDPRFSFSAGRQRFYDTYGIWWDDSIESLRFDYRDAFSHGFVAVAQKFWNYNTDVNSLDPTEENTRYAMGEYAWRWSERNWVGARVLHEDDRSNADPDDPQDFTGTRAGLFFSGDDLRVSPLFSDYHLEAVRLRGRTRTTDADGVSERGDSRGWLMLGEVGKRFHDAPWEPRIALRAGLTDAPDNEADGFRLNRIQSDRIVNPSSYSTRLVSSFVALNMRNLKYYGVALETRPTARSSLDIRLSDLYLRDADGDLPVRVDQQQARDRRQAIRAGRGNGQRDVGQVLDLNYYWKMFPLAYEGKHLDLNALVSASYLRAGDALESGDDFQISFGLVMRY